MKERSTAVERTIALAESHPIRYAAAKSTVRWLAGAASAALLAALLTACANHPSMVRVGENAVDVRARLGPPFETVKRDAGERLVYPLGAFSQQAYLVEVGADGRVAAVTQALTDARFRMIEIGQWDQARMRQEFGPPAETGVIPLKHQRVWSYRYKRDGVWDSLMHVYFDPQGKVQNYHPGPDPFFDPEDRFSGLLRPW